MKILYLSQRFGLNSSGIYADLVREIDSNGHSITVLTSYPENHASKSVPIKYEGSIRIIYFKSSGLFSYNKIYKGIAQLLLPFRMTMAIKKHLLNSEFDLILYPTPPITFTSVIKFCKKKFNAVSFLMLKDIFPQNAIDLGYMKKNSLIHNFYKLVEKDLYLISDKIGCMTQANTDFIKKNHPKIKDSKLTYFPNTVNCKGMALKKYNSKRKYTTFIFGGNLGIPQDVPALLKNIKLLPESLNAKFIIIGDGYYKDFIKKFIKDNPDLPIKYMNELPRIEFDNLLSRCDVGLVTLNSDFTVPNFPARILSYMSIGIPILAMLDDATDAGAIIEKAACGYSGRSSSSKDFIDLVKKFCNIEDLRSLGQNGQNYLKNNFNVNKSVKKLENFVSNHSNKQVKVLKKL